MRVKLIISSFLIFLSLMGFAQQDPVYTQYMFNGMLINPAYAGSEDHISVSALSRFQWGRMSNQQGWQGGSAPTTHTFTAQSLAKNKVDGLGGMVFHDQVGVSTRVGAMGMFSHRVVTKPGILILGLQGGFTSFSYSEEEWNLKDDVDNRFNGAESNGGIAPNFGAGFLFMRDNMYLSGAVPKLIPNPLGSNGGFYKEQIHFYLGGGYSLDVNQNVSIKPNVMLRYVEGAPMQGDLNLNVEYQDIGWLGVSYRTRQSIDLIAEVKVAHQLRIGYSYDIPFGVLAPVIGGAHEFGLKYNFSIEKQKTPVAPADPRDF